MESVKKERVSPILSENSGYSSETSSRPCPPVPPPVPPPQPDDHKTTVKTILASIPTTNSSLPSSLAASVITTTATVAVGAGGDISIQRTANSRGGGSISTANSIADAAIVDAVLLSGSTNFSGEISDAVSKILEDYDWSQIPLANKDGADDSERRKVHVKRPMNAFMVWAQEARRKLSCSHRQVHNAELSKSLGRIWRGMTEDQKRPFIERADHLRRKHKQEYPDYKYQPRRRKENVKTVSGKSPQAGHLGVELPGGNHFVSNVKGGALGLSLHPLSPPHSPSGQGRTHPDPNMGETMFTQECFTDSFETIDRAEMNKYLLPDQSPGGHYVTHGGHVPPAGLQTMTSMSTMSSMNTMSVPSSSSSTCSSSLTTGTSGSLTSLPPLGSRLLPPAPVYGGPSSPYYQGGASPQHGNHGSPDTIAAEVGTGTSSVGGVSPGGSPGSPTGEYVELQPPRVPKEEPLPPLTAPKPANVNPFLHQNLCYSTQPYAAFQYSYPYATMWH